MRGFVLMMCILSSLPLFSQTEKIENFLKDKIENWVAFKKSNAEFLDDKDCNIDTVVKHKDYPEAPGFKGITSFYFRDFDNDGDIDCVFTYEVCQCDGGNALWYTEEYGIVENHENKYANVSESNDLYFSDYKNRISKLESDSLFNGFLVFDSITDENEIILKEFIWSKNADRYPDKHRFHFFSFKNGMELKIEKSTEIENE